MARQPGTSLQASTGCQRRNDDAEGSDQSSLRVNEHIPFKSQPWWEPLLANHSFLLTLILDENIETAEGTDSEDGYDLIDDREAIERFEKTEGFEEIDDTNEEQDREMEAVSAALSKAAHTLPMSAAIFKSNVTLRHVAKLDLVLGKGCRQSQAGVGWWRELCTLAAIAAIRKVGLRRGTVLWHPKRENIKVRRRQNITLLLRILTHHGAGCSQRVAEEGLRALCRTIPYSSLSHEAFLEPFRTWNDDDGDNPMEWVLEDLSDTYEYDEGTPAHEVVKHLLTTWPRSRSIQFSGLRAVAALARDHSARANLVSGFARANLVSGLLSDGSKCANEDTFSLVLDAMKMFSDDEALQLVAHSALRSLAFTQGCPIAPLSTRPDKLELRAAQAESPRFNMGCTLGSSPLSVGHITEYTTIDVAIQYALHHLCPPSSTLTPPPPLPSPPPAPSILLRLVPAPLPSPNHRRLVPWIR